MGRRAAELIGVLVASGITSYVTGLATASPGEPVQYIVGTVVPLALLLAYWLWIEPRAAAERIRAKRLAQAVEDAFDQGQPSTDAPRDAARRAFYDRLEIADLFEPDHSEASSILGAALDAGRDLRRRLETDDPAGLRIEIAAWEERTERQIASVRGPWDPMSFRFTAPPAQADRAAQIEQLDEQLILLTGWVNDERKRAAAQAKDRYQP